MKSNVIRWAYERSGEDGGAFAGGDEVDLDSGVENGGGVVNSGMKVGGKVGGGTKEKCSKATNWEHPFEPSTESPLIMYN